MTIQHRQQILRLLSNKLARDSHQALSKEDLLAHIAAPWEDLRLEVIYLEEKGYLKVKRIQWGRRVFESYYLTADGVDWVEGQVIDPFEGSSHEEQALPSSVDGGLQTERTVSIFISYAQKDTSYLEELEKHLSLLERRGLINLWYGHKMSAGEEWQQRIETYLNTAQIILLLVSPDYMATDYCYNVEMKRAMERYESGEACVIPILLRPVVYNGAPFEKLQMLPTNGKPLTNWTNHDEAFQEIAKGISKAVKDQACETAQFSLIASHVRDIGN